MGCGTFVPHPISLFGSSRLNRPALSTNPRKNARVIQLTSKL